MWIYIAAVLFAITVWIISRLDFSPREQIGRPQAGVVPRKSDIIEEARVQLGHAVATAAKQDQIVWAIFGIFWTADAVLLVALFTSGHLPSREVAIVVAVVGFVLSSVWSIIQFRSIAAFQYYESIIARLESDEYLAIPADVALTRRLNKVNARGFRVRYIMVGCPAVSIGAWLLFLIFAICQL
jgi:hypothetical protein